MTSYDGPCLGGPHDGLLMAHWARSKTYLRPVVTATARILSTGHVDPDAPIESAPVGTYHFSPALEQTPQQPGRVAGTWVWTAAA